MEKLCDIFGHPHKLVVSRVWGHELRHKVANGLYGIAQTERERCRGTPGEVSGRTVPLRRVASWRW